MKYIPFRLSVLALALAASTGGPAHACGAVTPCSINNGQPLEDIAKFWQLVRSSPDPATVVKRVEAKFGALPIDFIGDDPKNRGRGVHVVIVGIKTDGVLYYSQAPVVNVDVSILAPTFSGPSRHLVPIAVGSISGASPAEMGH